MTARTQVALAAAPRPAECVSVASKNIPETGVVRDFNSQEPNGLGGVSKGRMFGYIPKAAVDQFHVMLERPKPTACLCPAGGAGGGRTHATCEDTHLDSRKWKLL